MWNVIAVPDLQLENRPTVLNQSVVMLLFFDQFCRSSDGKEASKAKKTCISIDDNSYFEVLSGRTEVRWTISYASDMYVFLDLYFLFRADNAVTVVYTLVLELTME